MKLSEPLKTQKLTHTDWFTFITDDRAKLVIPVGPRFQVEVPPWTDSPVCRNLDDSKWIGTQIWPVKGKSISNHNNSIIARGRSDTCKCAFPGSTECIKKHISRKRLQLQIDLGPAFWIWKFDEMGEDVSKLWNLKEERKFECIFKMNTTSQTRSLLKLALESLPRKNRGSIVSYYLNVYIPRRISVESRSSCVTIDTDGDDDDDDADNVLCLKGSRKRLQANGFKFGRCKYAKRTYLHPDDEYAMKNSTSFLC